MHSCRRTQARCRSRRWGRRPWLGRASALGRQRGRRRRHRPLRHALRRRGPGPRRAVPARERLPRHVVRLSRRKRHRAQSRIRPRRNWEKTGARPVPKDQTPEAQKALMARSARPSTPNARSSTSRPSSRASRRPRRAASTSARSRPRRRRRKPRRPRRPRRPPRPRRSSAALFFVR